MLWVQCGKVVPVEKTFCMTVFSHILKLAAQQNFSSVAIPAISSGVFGFPPTTSTSVIVEAIKNFLDEKSGTGPLSEIHLLDTRPQIGHAFSQSITKYFKLEEPGVFKFQPLKAAGKTKTGSRSHKNLIKK